MSNGVTELQSVPWSEELEVEGSGVGVMTNDDTLMASILNMLSDCLDSS